MVQNAVPQEFEKVRLVLVIGEDGLTIVPPLDHVLRIAGQNIAGQAGYGTSSIHCSYRARLPQYQRSIEPHPLVSSGVC